MTKCTIYIICTNQCTEFRLPNFRWGIHVDCSRPDFISHSIILLPRFYVAVTMVNFVTHVY